MLKINFITISGCRQKRRKPLTRIFFFLTSLVCDTYKKLYNIICDFGAEVFNLLLLKNEIENGDFLLSHCVFMY